MPLYIPSDNPQVIGLSNTTNTYIVEHESQFKAFGPLSPNVYVARRAHKPHI
jgi:hypothetical protein